MVGWNGAGMGINNLAARAVGCLVLAGNRRLTTAVQKDSSREGEKGKRGRVGGEAPLALWLDSLGV